ncbi:DUF2637 domain-containing protein [Brachybacterium alimentarium]|uniref:DUF2637 domain-containing protein n=1 Tax=Brachybacterium alimentarium TaxID=47845 RepID=UPI003FB967B9
MNPVERRGWAVVTAASGTVLIGAGAFWLSFTALADLAMRSGIAAGQAWIWPLLVDGLIVVATVAVVALDGHRTAWYPWALLIAGALVSVTANAAHAFVTAEATVPGVLAATVAAVPPLVLLASTHLTVVLIRSTRTTSAPAAVPTAPVPLSAPSAEAEAPDREAPEAPALVEPPETEEFAAPVTHELVAPEPAEADAPEGGVGRRERAARLRGEGWSNKQIARAMGVHPSTVGRWLPRPPDPELDPDSQGSSESSGPTGVGIPSDRSEEESS